MLIFLSKQPKQGLYSFLILPLITEPVFRRNRMHCHFFPIALQAVVSQHVGVRNWDVTPSSWSQPLHEIPIQKNLVIIGKWAALCFAPGRSLSNLVRGILIFRSSAKVCGYYPCGFSGRGAVCWVPGVPRVPRVPRGPSERWLERAWWWLTILIWVNYNDLTVLPHWKSWLVRGIIPFYGLNSG